MHSATVWSWMVCVSRVSTLCGGKRAILYVDAYEMEYIVRDSQESWSSIAVQIIVIYPWMNSLVVVSEHFAALKKKYLQKPNSFVSILFEIVNIAVYP